MKVQTSESFCFILPSYPIHQNIRILSPYYRGISSQRHRTVYESPQYVQIDSDDSFIAFSFPSSLCFLTPSERRFVRSMTTGTRNHISSDREALSLILGLFFAKIAILCV